MAVRLSSFEQVHGFNEKVIAGEDSELGVRMGLASLEIIKLDHEWPFTMRKYSDSGPGGRGQFAQDTPSRNAMRSTAGRVYMTVAARLSACAVGVRRSPTAVLLFLWPTRGLSLLLLGWLRLVGLARLSPLPVQEVSVAADALLVTRFTLYAKFANLIGVVRYGLNRVRGQFRIIEYK